MEWLEPQAITTATIECKPELWKKYVDNVLEIFYKGNNHLNTVDPTENIKFTHEEDDQGRIRFLTTLL